MTDDTRRKLMPVCFVGAGPGNPELMTLRGQQLLREANVVFHDSGLDDGLFRSCSEGCRRIDVGHLGTPSAKDVERTAAQMIEAAKQGHRVVRLKSGDPLFYSRALDELTLLRRAGIAVEIVPGVASPHGAAAYAGVPLTDVQGSQKLAFVAATSLLGQPFDPRQFAELAAATDTLCVMLVADQLHAVVRTLLEQQKYRNARALLVYRATLPTQRVVEAPLSELENHAKAHSLKEPSLLLLGDGLRHREALNWYESQPLFGKRLLLCRPSGQAQESANAILRHGACVELLPLIEIGPIDGNRALVDCVNRVHDADWVIFTSANGVDSFRRVVNDLGKDARVFGQAKIAVIGPGTARPLGAFGLQPDIIAKEHVAESLAREILDAGRVNRVMLIRALEARDALPDALRAAGVEVEIVPAYQTSKLANAQGERLAQLLNTGSIDAVLLTSSSMADSLVAALGEKAVTALANVCVASIGPITTATLETHGVKPDVTATTFTVDGLLDALESYFVRRGNAQ